MGSIDLSLAANADISEQYSLVSKQYTVALTSLEEYQSLYYESEIQLGQALTEIKLSAADRIYKESLIMKLYSDLQVNQNMMDENYVANLELLAENDSKDLKISMVSYKLAELKDMNQSQDAAISNLRQELTESNALFEHYRKELAVAEIAISEHLVLNGTHLSQISRLATDLESSESDNRQIGAENAALAANLAQCRSQISIQQSQFETLKIHSDHFSFQLESAHTEATIHTNTILGNLEAIKALKEDGIKLKYEVDSKSLTINGLELSLAQMQAESLSLSDALKLSHAQLEKSTSLNACGDNENSRLNIKIENLECVAQERADDFIQFKCACDLEIEGLVATVKHFSESNEMKNVEIDLIRQEMIKLTDDFKYEKESVSNQLNACQLSLEKENEISRHLESELLIAGENLENTKLDFKEQSRLQSELLAAAKALNEIQKEGYVVQLELLTTQMNKALETTECQSLQLEKLRLDSLDLETALNQKIKELAVSEKKLETGDNAMDILRTKTKIQFAEKEAVIEKLQANISKDSKDFESTVQSLTHRLSEKSMDLKKAEMDKSDAYNKIGMMELKHSNLVSSRDLQIKSLEVKIKEFARSSEQANTEAANATSSCAKFEEEYSRISNEMTHMRELASDKEETAQADLNAKKQIEGKVLELESQIEMWTDDCDRYLNY